MVGEGVNLLRIGKGGSGLETGNEGVGTSKVCVQVIPLSQEEKLRWAGQGDPKWKVKSGIKKKVSLKGPRHLAWLPCRRRESQDAASQPGSSALPGGGLGPEGSAATLWNWRGLQLRGPG